MLHLIYQLRILGNITASEEGRDTQKSEDILCQTNAQRRELNKLITAH